MNSRIPSTCPPGFQGRYTVVPGDTMFFIAQRFGVSLVALIAANPHIADPDVLFSGMFYVSRELTVVVSLPCAHRFWWSLYRSAW